MAEGDLDRIRRQRKLRRPYGFDDELRAALSGLPIALDATDRTLRDPSR